MRKVQIKDIFYSNQESIKLSNYDFINYLDTSSITMSHIDNIQKLYIGEEAIPSRAKRLIKKDTIVYSSVRPNLKHYGIIRNPLNNMVASTGFITLDIQDETKNDANYMYYNLTQDKYTDYLHTIACNNVSSYPSINPSDIEDMEIEIETDIGNQKKIAKLFVDIDKKIELNNKINSELENIAKTLYDYWFVQFEFPDKNERPYKSSGGAMVYNNVLKREIPVSWSNCTLNDICEMYQPQTLQEDNLIDSGQFFVYGANGIIGKYNEYNHAESEIAIACRGNSCGVPNRTLPNSWITGNAMVIKLKDAEIHNEYLYHALNYTNIKGVITGSGQPQITRVNLAPVKIIKPNKDIVLKYCSLIKDNVELRLKNELENRSLINLRDFILPMLMNGQVAIRQQSQPVHSLT